MTLLLAAPAAELPASAESSNESAESAPNSGRAVPESFLLTTGVLDSQEAHQWPPHTHDEHELIWSARGAITVTVGDRMWSVLPGTGLWIPRGVVHEAFVARGVASRVTLFSPETWKRGWPVPTAVKVNEAVQQLLIHMANNGMPAQERLRAQQVCIDLLEPLQNSAISVPIPTDPRIKELVNSVLCDPSDERSLEQWARRLNLSSRTITRVFGADVAMSFAQWRRLVRMKAACGLLAQGMSVGSAGRRVGYGTASAFVAAFREVVGCTPGEMYSPN